MERVEEEPHISTRRLAAEVGVSQFVVHRTLKEQARHPYHVQKVQALYNGLYNIRKLVSRQINSFWSNGNFIFLSTKVTSEAIVPAEKDIFSLQDLQAQRARIPSFCIKLKVSTVRLTHDK